MKALNLLCDQQYEKLGLTKNILEMNMAAKELIVDGAYGGILTTKTWCEINRLEFQHNLLKRTKRILFILKKELKK